MAELQTIHTLTDGSLAIEEPAGGVSLFEESKGIADFAKASFSTSAVGALHNLVADINEDGKPDFLVDETGTGKIRVFLNVGNYDFTEMPSVLAGASVTVPQTGVYYPAQTGFALGDTDGDGILDIIVSRQISAPDDNNNQGMAVARGLGGGRFAPAQLIPESINDQVMYVNAADVNGDGRDDVLGTYPYIGFYGQPKLLLSAGTGYNLLPINATPLRFLRSKLIDLEGDGDADVVTGGLGVYINDGAFNFTETSYGIFVTRQLLDETLDLYADSRSGTTLGVSVGDTSVGVARYDRVAKKFVQIRTFDVVNGDIPWIATSFVDANGDGLVDILLSKEDSGGVAISYASELGVFSDPVTLALGHGLVADALADFDGDGTKDLASVSRFGIHVDFANSGTPTYASPFGDFSRMARTPDGGYQRRYKDGTLVNFNAAGLQTSIKDVNGNTTGYAYDAAGHVTQITDPLGLVTTFTYSGGRLSATTTPDGRVTHFEYDALGRLIDLGYPDASTMAYAYDSEGRMTVETDQRGNSSTFTYGAGGRLASSQRSDGSSISLGIAKTIGLAELGAPPAKWVDPADRVTHLTDAKGTPTEMEVNEWGALIRRTDELGRVTNYTRSAANLVTSISEPDNSNTGRLITELDYDVQGNVIAKREAIGTSMARQTTYEYEPAHNRLIKTTEPAGSAGTYPDYQSVTTYAYDAAGNLTGQTNPLGGVNAYTYNANGLKTSMTDERGFTTTYSYNARGLLDITTDPAGIHQRNAYNARGNRVLSIAAEGTSDESRTSYTYDVMNRVISMTDGEGDTSTMGYDSAGNEVLAKDATGVVVTRTYDSLGQLIAISDPSSGTSAIAYDVNGNINSVTDNAGAVTVTSYDAANRVTQTVDGSGTTRRVAYDSRNNVIAITDGNGSTTTMGYDILDHMLSRTNAVGSTWIFTYDSRDINQSIIKPDGHTLSFGVDKLGRLTGIAADTYTQVHNYIYDVAGNVIRTSPTADAYIYDNRGQLVNQSYDYNRAPPSITYGYDALGRKIQMTDSIGASTRWAYNRASDLTSVTLPSGKIVSFANDAVGRRNVTAFPNGLSEKATFATPLSGMGATGNLTSIAHGLLSGNATGSAVNLKLGTTTYAYDVRGNIVAANQNTVPPRNRSFVYDVIERLTSVKDGAGTVLESYALDKEGNRITSHLSSFHVTNPANRLTEDQDYIYEYSLTGSLVTKSHKSDGITWRYDYNPIEQLIRARKYNGSSLSDAVLSDMKYTYDGFGRLIDERHTIGNANTRQFRRVYDGENLAWREEGDGFFYSNRNWFTHGAGTDDLIAVTPDAGQTGGSLYAIAQKSWYYHTDHQGSVRALSDDLGAVANSYSYDAYGNAETAVESYPNQPFRYTGQEFDPDTGLAQYRARWLDMANARFLQEDPMGFDAGDLNVYRYVGNNPVNFVDPSGMDAENTATTTPVLTAGGSIASVGRNLACSFTTFAGIIAIAGDIGGELGIIDPAYGEVAGVIGDAGQALGCGVRSSKKITVRDACGKTQSKIVRFLFSALNGLKTLNSFSEDTTVLTKQGTKQIKDIAVGDIVAARDEKTGDIVWRHVVEKFERTAPSSLHITLENSKGVRETITTTSEHPFHIEDWDGKVETMVADLNGVTKIDPARLFPSDGKTPFGEWVKAGALKAGDQVSNLTSIKPAANDNAFGPRVAANDNKALTITDIANDSEPTRVYNFEVESRDGEFTHNYFVGDEQAWAHNAGVGRGDPRITWLYKLFDQRGNFLKHGISCNPATRYPKSKKFRLVRQKCGCRSDMLDEERQLIETDPGPLNFEPWAGSGMP